MSNHKTLYLLIGMKGSGKTHIGKLLAQRTDIFFLQVEPIWLTVQPGENGWEKVEGAIDDCFLTHNRVMIESLGAGDGFSRFYASLSAKYQTKMIHVVAGFENCLERVKTRSKKDHIDISDAQVAAYNKIAAEIRYDWAAEIDNDPPASPESILAAFQRMETSL